MNITNKLRRYIKSPPRTNKYQLLLFPPPAVMEKITVQNLKYITLVVYSTSLPQKRNNKNIIKLKGKDIVLRGFQTMVHDWEFKFYDNNKYSILDIFDYWISLVDNTSSDANTQLNYFGDAIISQLDYNGNPSKSYKLPGIFPTEVLGNSFSSEELNSTHLFSTSLVVSDIIPI